MRQIHVGRVVLAAIVAEAVPIVLLILLVAVLGPREPAGAEKYAARLGQWVGPIGGAVMCFIAARWVARKAERLRVTHGALVGAGAALLDIALLVGSGAAFEWLFVVSNAGRVIAGAGGGLAADAWRRRGA